MRLLQPTSSHIRGMQAPNPVKDTPVQPRSKPPVKDQLLDPHHLEMALLAVSETAILAHPEPEVATLGARKEFADRSQQ